MSSLPGSADATALSRLTDAAFLRSCGCTARVQRATCSGLRIPPCSRHFKGTSRTISYTTSRSAFRRSFLPALRTLLSLATSSRTPRRRRLGLGLCRTGNSNLLVPGACGTALAERHRRMGCMRDWTVQGRRAPRYLPGCSCGQGTEDGAKGGSQTLASHGHASFAGLEFLRSRLSQLIRQRAKSLTFGGEHSELASWRETVPRHMAADTGALARCRLPLRVREGLA